MYDMGEKVAEQFKALAKQCDGASFKLEKIQGPWRDFL